jgi:hypothetical protein
MLTCFQCKGRITDGDYQTVSVVEDLKNLEIFNASEYHFHSKCVAIVLLQYIAYVLEYEQHIDSMSAKEPVGNA